MSADSITRIIVFRIKDNQPEVVDAYEQVSDAERGIKDDYLPDSSEGEIYFLFDRVPFTVTRVFRVQSVKEIVRVT